MSMFPTAAVNAPIDLCDRQGHDRSSAATTPMVDVVRWVEARLHETVGSHVIAARLYGLEVIDPELFAVAGSCAARMSFVAEHAEPSELVFGAAARCVERFDVVVLAGTRWQCIDSGSVARPGSRRRARVTVAVGDAGAATVVRVEDEPGATAAAGLGGGGGAALLLAAVWSTRSGAVTAGPSPAEVGGGVVARQGRRVLRLTAGALAAVRSLEE